METKSYFLLLYGCSLNVDNMRSYVVVAVISKFTSNNVFRSSLLSNMVVARVKCDGQ